MSQMPNNNNNDIPPALMASILANMAQYYQQQAQLHLAQIQMPHPPMHLDQMPRYQMPHALPYYPYNSWYSSLYQMPHSIESAQLAVHAAIPGSPYDPYEYRPNSWPAWEPTSGLGHQLNTPTTLSEMSVDSQDASGYLAGCPGRPDSSSLPASSPASTSNAGKSSPDQFIFPPEVSESLNSDPPNSTARLPQVADPVPANPPDPGPSGTLGLSRSLSIIPMKNCLYCGYFIHRNCPICPMCKTKTTSQKTKAKRPKN